MKKLPITLIAFLVVTLAFTYKNAYSSVIMYDPRFPVSLTSEKAVIYYDEKSKEETLVVSPTFKQATPASLVGYWKFDEGSGQLAADSSIYKNNGYLSSSFSNIWATGKLGNALNFAAATYQQEETRLMYYPESEKYTAMQAYVSVAGNDSLNIKGAFTLDAWLYPELSSCSSLAKGAVISKSDASAGYELLMYKSATGTYTLELMVNNTSLLKVEDAVVLNKWSHVAAVVDDQSSRLYVNGTSVATGKSLYPLSTAGRHLQIGKRTDAYGVASGCSFEGRLDDVKVFSYALTGDELSANYQNGLAGKVYDVNSSDAMKTLYKGFSWLMPVPSKPEVSVVKDDLFDSLEKLTQPIYTIQNDVRPMMGVGTSSIEPFDAAEKTTSSVTVVQTKKVDVYDLTVLEANNKEGLYKWLSDNNYVVNDNTKFILNDYVDKGYYFVLAKVNSTISGDVVLGQIREGHLNPIKMVFKSEKPILPVRLMGGSDDKTKQLIRGMQPEAMYDYMNPANLTLDLYVIGNHKAYIPGYEPIFAGHLEEKTLEKLATDDKDQKWLDFSGRKFVTRMTKYVSRFELNNDLVVQNDENDTPVGAGEIHKLFSKNVILVLVVVLPVLVELAAAGIYFSHKRKAKEVK